MHGKEAVRVQFAQASKLGFKASPLRQPTDALASREHADGAPLGVQQAPHHPIRHASNHMLEHAVAPVELLQAVYLLVGLSEFLLGLRRLLDKSRTLSLELVNIRAALGDDVLAGCEACEQGCMELREVARRSGVL